MLALDALRAFVEREIETYEIGPDERAIGRPLPGKSLLRGLAEMRESLVPSQWYLVELRDDPDSRETRNYVLVARDKVGYMLFYDPVEHEFMLAMGAPPRTMGVRGDAVGCFLAR